MIKPTSAKVTQLMIDLVDILSIIQIARLRRILVIMHSDISTSNADTHDPRTYLALLGRQPDLSLAELEQVFDRVTPLSELAASFQSNRAPDVQRLGGTTKAGEIVAEFEAQDWSRLSRKIVQYYVDRLRSFDGKVTIGISVYGHDVAPREVQG